MARITALKLTRQRKVKVCLDNNFSFTLNGKAADEIGLKVGQIVSDSQIDEIKEVELLERCLKAALKYLNYRPRSEAEIKQRLYRRGFATKIVEKVILELKEKKLIDDASFARFWIDNRLLFKPLSQRLLSIELQQKGVAKTIIDEVIQDVDDRANALKAGQKRVPHLSTLDYPEFRYRLTDYLRRRGFSYDTIDFAVNCLWQQKQDSKLCLDSLPFDTSVEQS